MTRDLRLHRNEPRRDGRAPWRRALVTARLPEHALKDLCYLRRAAVLELLNIDPPRILACLVEPLDLVLSAVKRLARASGNEHAVDALDRNRLEILVVAPAEHLGQFLRNRNRARFLERY